MNWNQTELESVWTGISVNRNQCELESVWTDKQIDLRKCLTGGRVANIPILTARET